MSLSGLLDLQADRRPEAEAVVDVDRVWSYEEVATRRGQVSAALMGLGIEPGTRVGVHCNKGVDGLIAMHAIVSVGAIAVPLDPASPPRRLVRICEQMQIDVVISHALRARSIAALHELRALRAVVGLDIETEADGLECVGPDGLARLDATAPVSVGDDALAYIITTSGSTGEPKGIVHTHGSAMAYAEMTERTFALTNTDRVSDIAPFHFDISTLSVWSVPLVGATNVVVNEAYQRLPASHSTLLADQAVTLWYSVPFLLQQLLRRGDLENRDLSALRWVHFGGEVMAPEIVAEMMRHCPNATFANIFGPAETNHCSLAVIDTPPPADVPLSIGYALDHTEVRVVDVDASVPDDAHMVDPGEKGELWVHTPQLMDGYWGQADTNAAVIKKIGDKQYYRTGDLVSMSADGELSFHGRIDHQVKVRGYRIELEGIEQILEKLGGVEHVVVGVFRAHSNQDELVAGLLGATSDFDEANFLQASASVLPSYAVPTKTVRIDQPTFTGSGKLDRRTLREKAVVAVKGNPE